MSDEPELSAADAERIRALLADARVTSPMPEDVVGRLDDVLAGLRAERLDTDRRDTDQRDTDQRDADRGPTTGPGPEETAGRGQASVVPLRRRLPVLLGAAAAVIVLGGAFVAVPHLVGGSGEVGTSGSSASSGGSAGKVAPEAGSAASGQTPMSAQLRNRLSAAGVPLISSAHLQRDTARAVTGNADLRRSPGPEGEQALRGCAGPSQSGTTATPVLLDGTLAALVEPVTGSPRAVAIWTCDGSRRLASVTLP